MDWRRSYEAADYSENPASNFNVTQCLKTHMALV
jgi:hypothetical protein